MRGSPGLFSSIQALIFASLKDIRMRSWQEGGDVPFVLFADKVLFAQVDEVGDGFCGEELETVDDVNLMRKRNG